MATRKVGITFTLIIIATLLHAAVFAQTPEERIQSIMNRPEFRHAFFGIRVDSLDSGKTLYSYNADKYFKPASTTKLLTMGTVLATLGADYRFHTKVYAAGKLKKGTLDGDLVLVASGDPNLSGRIQKDGTLAFKDEDHSYDGQAVEGDPLLVIRQIAGQIASRGIKKIKGRVLIDTSLFPPGGKELGTEVVLSPIAVNDNVIDVVFTPGKQEGDPVTISISPQSAYVKFINQVKTGAADSEDEIDMSADVADARGFHTVTIQGKLPPGEAVLHAYAVPEPSLFAATVLEEALRERKIKVENKGKEAPNFLELSEYYKEAYVLAEHISPPLSEEVKVVLKVSQNLHASMWPAILGAVVKNDHIESYQSGFDVEREFLTKAGLDLLGAAQGDGAGGAEAGVYTPDFMVQYLTYMQGRSDFAYFHNALPIMGRDGTLYKVQKESAAAGRVHAKTGTYGDYDMLNRRLMLTAKGLAGYITSASGERLVFAAYVNRVPMKPSEITAIAGQALGEIAAAAYDMRTAK